jgi:ribosomal protein L11 methyltransferase
MTKHLEGESVLDVGCGSGILAIAAISLGCPSSIALDIDVKALEHAHHNAVINGMENQIKFYTPESWDPLDIPPTVLMNMISSEQVVAWNSLKPAQYQFKKVLTSGVSKDEREFYLEMIKNWGLDCLAEIEQEGWLGFVLAQPIPR